MRYDHPNYLVLREAHKEQLLAASAAAATAGFLGTTFRTYGKSVVIGVAVKVAAAGSGGGCVVAVARAQGDAALSLRDVVTITMAASAVTAFIFTSPITLLSLNDTIALHGSASAATDIPTVRSVVWRYRMLPTAATGDVGDDFTNAQLG